MTYLETFTDNEILRSVYTVLRRMEGRLADALERTPTLELPPINVPPPDLADVVNAVNSLRPGPSAEEIARALADVLAPNRSPQEGAEALGEVARALEKLDFRLRGIGNQAYGGGAVSFTEQALTQLGGVYHQSSTDTVHRAVAATTTPFTVLAASDYRMSSTVYVEPASSNLYIKFGTNPSANSFSNRLGPGDYWESSPPRHSGPVTGVFDGTAGRIQITEFIFT